MSKTFKILIVDDEEDLVQVLGQILKDNYFDVCSAHSGEEGVTKAREEKPDLILMDIMMSELSGGEVVRILRQDEETKKIPVLFISALAENEGVISNQSTIIVDEDTYPIIAKPYKPEELIEMMHKLLRENS